MTFKSGKSGNPAGRPKGSRDRKNVVAAEFAKEGSEIARVVIDAAKEGDMQAASLILQRLSPPLRAQAEKVQFAFDPSAPVADQATQILTATASGDIDPDTCKMLLDCLCAFAGLKDVEHFIDELKRLKDSRSATIPGGVQQT